MQRIFKATVILLLVLSGTYANTVILVKPFFNSENKKKWDWIGYAIEEACTRNINSWNNIELYPNFQSQPDSSGICLEPVAINGKTWSNLWHINYVVGGTFRVKNDQIQLRLLFRSVKDSSELIYTNIAGYLTSTQNLSSLICKRISELIEYNLSNNELQDLERIPTKNNYAYTSFVTGYKNLKSNNYQTAIYALERAIELDPNFAEANYMLGIALFKIDNIKISIEHLYRAIELKPLVLKYRVMLAKAYLSNNQNTLAKRTISGMPNTDNPDLLNIEGMIYLKESQYNRAVSLFLRALNKNPSNSEYSLNLGIAYTKLGQHNQAIEIFKKLSSLYPNNIEYMCYLGIGYRETGYLLEGLKKFNMANKIEPNNPMVLLNIAVTYDRLNWHKKTKNILDKAINIDPKNSEILSNMGVLSIKSGDTTQAIELLNKAIALDKTNSLAYNYIGTLNIAKNNWGKAKINLENAIKYGTKDVSTFINIARVYTNIGDNKKAMKYTKEAILLAPNNFTARKLFSELLVKSNLLEEAANNYNEYLDLCQDDDSARITLSHILSKLDYKEEAVEQMEFVIDRNQGVLKYDIELANLYRKIGWYKIGFIKYKNLYKSHPKNLDILWGLGSICYLIGNTNRQNSDMYDKSLFYLKTAIDIDSNNEDALYWMGLVQLNYKQDKMLAKRYWKTLLSPSYKGKYKQEIEKYRNKLK